jgi:hypothetical protein
MLLVCCVLVILPPPPAHAALQLGVQGHCDGTGGQTPYRPGDLGSGVTTQLADVRALGPPNDGPVWYRNGIACGVVNGTVDAPCVANYAHFAKEAAEQHIALLPILFPPIPAELSTDLYAVTATAELWAFQVSYGSILGLVMFGSTLALKIDLGVRRW